MSTTLSAHQALQFNSLAFALFVFFAVSSILLSRKAKIHGFVMAIVNLIFLYFFIQGVSSFIFLTTILSATYIIAEIKARFSDKIPGWIFKIGVIILWLCLFFVKDPGFGGILNPFQYIPVHLIGVSFLLFRSINYLEDADLFQKRSPLKFLNFMLYFPTLISGPIERYESFIRYYERPAPLTKDVLLQNMHRIANGFIKKFIIADNLYPFTTFGNSGFEDLSSPMLWGYVLLQLPVLYLDFSGYCDIVIGISRLMGIPIIENFDKPYKARNVQEFWARWHISLTSFVKDYVFIPFNRVAMTYLPRKFHVFAIHTNSFLTMLIIALWHGTTWGFFVFGLLHGTAIIIAQMQKKYVDFLSVKFPAYIWIISGYRACILNFIFISLTMLCWYFSPAESLDIVLRLMGGTS